MNTVCASELRGIASSSYYSTNDSNSIMRDCILNEKNIISTNYGRLIPKYGEDEVRRKYNHSISFYPNSALKSISLESQTSIATEMGTFPAELVTFYESGALKRLFPLNGRISGYWTETDEEKLCNAFEFSFPFGSFKAKIINLYFYESGKLKAVTLWPGEEITLNTSQGLLPVRIGFSLYEDGSIKSLEPASPLLLPTPIGEVVIFDETALGICGDNNSLCFNENGTVASLLTTYGKIAVFSKDGTMDIIEPPLRPDPMNIGKKMLVPLKISFEKHFVKFEGDRIWIYDLYTTRFSINNMNNSSGLNKSYSCTDCSTCGLCNG